MIFLIWRTWNTTTNACDEGSRTRMATKLAHLHLKWSRITVCTRMEGSLYFVTVKRFCRCRSRKVRRKERKRKNSCLKHKWTRGILRNWVKKLNIPHSHQRKLVLPSRRILHQTITKKESLKWRKKRSGKRRSQLLIKGRKGALQRKKYPLRKVRTGKGEIKAGKAGLHKLHQLNQNRTMHVTSNQLRLVDHVIKHHVIWRQSSQIEKIVQSELGVNCWPSILIALWYERLVVVSHQLGSIQRGRPIIPLPWAEATTTLSRAGALILLDMACSVRSQRDDRTRTTAIHRNLEDASSFTPLISKTIKWRGWTRQGSSFAGWSMPCKCTTIVSIRAPWLKLCTGNLESKWKYRT